MRFRGGGVGHSNTRDATNRFLTDRHPLDAAIDEDQIEDEGGEISCDEAGSGGDKNTERGDEEMRGMSLDEDADSEGRGNSESGGGGGHDDEERGVHDDELELNDVDLDGTIGHEEGRGGEEDDEEDDYGYKIGSDGTDSDEETDREELGEDIPDDVLGPEDGGGDEDEVNLLGFANY